MATSTTTLALRKPATTDTVDVTTDLNTPFDTIDDQFTKGSDVASASSITVPDESYFDITGTTTITAFSTVNAGIMKMVQFDGVLTLTHHSSSLNLPTGANIATAAGDRALLRSEGSGNWRCMWFQKASGAALKIADESIDSDAYVDGSIDAAHIASNAVTTVKINADAVTAAKIADDALDSEHYTDGSIDAAHLASNAVTTVKINADAVTAAKIADDVIDSEHYVDGSIDAAHIASSAVTTAKINNDAVTLAKLAGGTDGELITWDASGDPAAVAVGSDTHVLTSNGAGAAPTFQAAAGGGYTPTVVLTTEFVSPAGGGPTSVGSNNNAIYCPINIPGDMTITKIAIKIGTSSGNIDVGIYNKAGTLQIATGSISSPGTGIRWMTVTSTALSAGQHWIAVASSNTTVTFFHGSTGGGVGQDTVAIEASDFPLPSTFTPPGIPSGTTGRTAYMMGVA